MKLESSKSCVSIVTRQGIIQGNVTNLSTKDRSKGNSSLLMKWKYKDELICGQLWEWQGLFFI